MNEPLLNIVEFWSWGMGAFAFMAIACGVVESYLTWRVNK